MSLIDLQREMQQVCLSVEPNQAALERLGDPHIFGVYRDMVRRRLYGELKFALKRTYACVGEAAFRDAFIHFMAEHPPRSRFFHGIPVEFAQAMLSHFDAARGAPPQAVDLLRFEAARWELSDLPGTVEQPVSEFSFDAPVVFNPTLRLMTFDYAIHEGEDEAPAARPTQLVMHRATDESPVSHFKVNALTFDLLSHLQTRGSTVSAAVQDVSVRRKVVVDDTFIEGLCTVLSDFLERRVILGTRTMEP